MRSSQWQALWTAINATNGLLVAYLVTRQFNKVYGAGWVGAADLVPVLDWGAVETVAHTAHAIGVLVGVVL